MPNLAQKNSRFLEWLQEMRDEEEHDSNKYMIYNKAFNSLKKESKEYNDPEALIEVKFIGPAIVQRLKNVWKAAGGVPTMGIIPSNIPPPGKRKRGWAAASSSASAPPKKRGRLPKQALFEETSDEDGEEHRFNNQSAPCGSPPAHVSTAFAAPRYPLGIPPQNHQIYHPPAPQLPSTHYHRYGYPLPPAPSQRQTAIAGAAHFHASKRDLVPTLPHGTERNLPFAFYYIDSDRKRVYDHTMAAVDIHSNTAWYKLCFPDSDQSRAHPLRQRLRLAPDKKGKGKETLVEAWISDQDVEQYVLHMAPGFTIANDPVDPELYRKPSDSASQSASCVCRREMDEALAQNKLGRVGKDSRGESLKDLLDAEKRKKRKPIGTSRTIGVNKEWEVENGGQTFRVQNKGQTEAARAHHEGAPSKELTMKQTLALAAVARQVPSSTAVEQSSAEARFSSAQPVSLVVNSAHHKSKPLLVDSSVPIASLPSGCISIPVTELRHKVAHGILPPERPVSKPKAKPKGRVRGRVSEFAPALPAVDEFDVDLGRQAANQHMRTARASEPTSDAPADLIDDITDLTTEAIPSFPAFDPIVFPADSYEIALVLDNREVKSPRHRDHIAMELRKKGVDVDQRNLALGDVLWIAKRKVPVYGAVDNECVLDYILERKRLDDLCMSIKEGRFHEQKFRLANTGLKVFYLIEDYDVEKNREHFGVQIDTARSSVQIVDGFILTETKKLSYTIEYLTIMHQTIVEMYQHQPLYVIPPHLVKRHSYMALQKHLCHNQPTMRFLTNYRCFEMLNSKSANLTTRDLFAQMLLCVKGMSAEKAAGIIHKYTTIRSLWEAFRVAEAVEQEGKRREEEAAAAWTQGNREKGRRKNSNVPLAKAMLCDLEASGRKRIGPVLGEKVYRLMRANVYE